MSAVRGTLVDLALLALPPKDVLFWSGAGISADAPTSAPVGNALADRTLDQAFAPDTAATVLDYYRRLRLNRTRPRLETLLDVVFRVHGDALLDDLLSDLRTAQPNALHGFFAEHLVGGGRHITANFDTCIERAHRGAVLPVLHFHGSFGGAPLGATLARIERGFPEDTRWDLQQLLLDPVVKLVVFVGYSGLDFFDVDPLLRELPTDCLAGRSALWINHDTSGVPRHVAPERKQLQWLRAAGASTDEICAPTRTIVDEFAHQWGIALIDPPGTPRSWRPALTVAADHRERATLELFALMNLHREVHSRLPAPTDGAGWELLAHTLWAEGRYVQAGDAWQQARAGASETARRERLGAIYWVRGQFRKARKELLTALEDETGPIEERLLVAELLARVLTHMRRFPDSRLVPTRRTRRLALEELPDPNALAAAGQPLGTHLRIRVASARAALGASSGTGNAHAVESFGEYEALGGQLNYRHAAMRGRLRRERVDPDEVRRLRADFDAIGAYGDAARTTLLGGISIFGWNEVITSARRLDVTGWHRIRLISASLTARLARAISLRISSRRSP